MVDLNLPVIDLKKCTLCGSCVDICPENVLAIKAGELVYAQPKQCTLCAECESICPEGVVACYYQINWVDSEEKNE